jgi:hypothetical protein
MSNLGMESIPTSTSLCPDLLMGDEKYGSFLGTTPMRQSLCSWVVVPSPQPNCGYGVAKRGHRRLQPLHEVIQQLRWEGLMGVDFLWTFFSHRVQPLHESSITKTLSKASKVAESPLETTSSVQSISESPEVMEVHLDWCISFMIYLRIGGLLEDKDECE